MNEFVLRKCVIDGKSVWMALYFNSKKQIEARFLKLEALKIAWDIQSEVDIQTYNILDFNESVKQFYFPNILF